MLIIAFAVLGAIIAFGFVLAPVTGALDVTLEAVLGVAARLVAALVPVGLLDGVLLEVVLAAVPAFALLGMAVLVRASTVVRRVVSVAALLATIASYAWLDGWQATLALAIIAAVAAAVSFGTTVVVAAPLALLSGALVVRTVVAIVDGAPAAGREALTVVTTLDGSGGTLVVVAQWVVLTIGVGVALQQWRRTV